MPCAHTQVAQEGRGEEVQLLQRLQCHAHAGVMNDESACDWGVILHSHDRDMVHEALLCCNQHDAYA